MFLNRLCGYTVDILFKELPLFLLTFFFLNPIWVGMIKNSPIEALKDLVCVDNIISCDFYITLLCSYVVILFIGFLPRIIKIPVKLFVYFVLASIFVIKKFLFNELQMGFTADVLTLVLQTTPNESSGFIDTYILNSTGVKYFLLFISCCVISGLAEFIFIKKIKKRTIKSSNRYIVIIILASAITMGSFSSSRYFELETYPECNSYTSINLSIKRLMETRKDSERFWKKMGRIDSENNVAECSEDSIITLFVLGESFQKAHASLYGYSLPTTPYSLEEKENGNLYLFDDLISPYSLTTPTMHSVMCLNSIADNEQWYDGIFFPQIFHKAGFDVYMWDSWKDPKYRYNNSFFEIYTPSVTTCWLTDENHNFYAYDFDYVSDFVSKVKFKSNRNLIIFHQIGSHFPYNKKYDCSDAKFTNKDIKNVAPYLNEEKKTLIAEYDNSILQTDKSLKLLYDKYRHSNAIIVFLSDHGDEVYDYRDKAVRPPMDDKYKVEYMHCMHDLPVFVWCSDTYKIRHPQIIKQLEKALDKPGMSDKIGYTMMTLSGISSKYYYADRDILNDSYKPTKRDVFFNTLNKETHRVSANRVSLNYDSIVGLKQN